MADWWLASLVRSTTTLSTAPCDGTRLRHARAMRHPRRYARRGAIEPCHEQLLSGVHEDTRGTLAFGLAAQARCRNHRGAVRVNGDGSNIGTDRGISQPIKSAMLIRYCGPSPAAGQTRPQATAMRCAPWRRRGKAASQLSMVTRGRGPCMVSVATTRPLASRIGTAMATMPSKFSWLLVP